ncbi:ABC transporter substrate-binding protein [Amycolatopsis endophytica]|uniref:Peptide/nickel transport system substrate-binding protein n=1 Tax=Amycolatopsis endophytica TaxID=860233 RepID=A0A853BEN3_9PSEU|nr:ABC transporter substrate-binding protein [Amycolatopsis endophytica]NYI93121.1 peptide/nickel transport system substrate-binding protein [Amycolatopsis endophytica]
MKTALTTAAAAVLAMALAACGGGTGATTVDGGTFTLVSAGDPGNLDPHFTSLSVTIQADRFLYDTLVNVDSGGALTAGLAEKWEGDTTTAKYTLRKGVTCSDGTPLTASQVADNINFVSDPANAAASLGLYVMPGAKATADDAAGTVTVTSATPDSFLVRNIGGLFIVCGRGMADRSILRQGADGTGMFTLTEAVAGDHYTLTRRKDYAWGPGDWKTDTRGLPDTVVIRVVGNELTASNLLVSKEVNAAAVVGPDQQRLKGMGLTQHDTESPLGELWFNQRPAVPGADVAVRRALTQALDLGQLGQVLTSGTGKPANGLLAPGLGPCGADTIAGLLPASDADAAKSGLDAAGWVAGADGVRTKGGKRLALTFYYPSTLGSTMQAAAELVQQRWSAVGAEVALKGMTDTESTQVLMEGNWDAALVPLGVFLPSQLVPFFSGSANNFAAVDNPAYEAAVQQATTIAGADGCGKWAEAEQALVRELNVVPFVNAVRPTFVQGATLETSQGSIDPASIRMLG